MCLQGLLPVRGEQAGRNGASFLRTVLVLVLEGSSEEDKDHGLWTLPLLLAILPPCLSVTFLIYEMGTVLFPTHRVVVRSL